MAGPSFVHYRNADNIVVGVFSNSVTPAAGVTEVNETHPVFIPLWTEVQWERTAPTAYTNTGVPADINNSFNLDNIVAVSADDINAGFLDAKIADAGSGKIAVAVATPGGDEDLTLDVVEANVDHDSLQNFVANEHIDHSTVTLQAVADSGLAIDGGNAAVDITASRTFALDIPGTTTEAGIDLADEFIYYDNSAAGNRSATFSDLATILGGTDTIAHNGVCPDVDNNEMVSARWGHNRGIAGITMPLAGNIVRISATVDATLTAGQIDVRATINGTEQNGAGQTATVTATNNNAFANYPTPVAVAASDILNMVSIGSGGLNPQNRDVTCVLYVTFT